MGACVSLHAWSVIDMRATTVMLAVAVVASTAQAVKIRGSRRKYIVDKPIENLTPAQKEYFVRLLWLMKNINGPVPNLGHEDPELKNKLANGGFYYDDDHANKESEADNHQDTPGEGIQQNLESENTNNSVHEEENSPNNGKHWESEAINGNIGNVNMSPPSENVITNNSPLRSQESNYILSPYLIFGHESDSQSKSNETEGSNAVESNSHSNEIDIISSNVSHDHEIDDSSQNYENQGFYIINRGEYNSQSREIDSSSRSNEFQLPYVANNDGHNSYSTEYDVISDENVNPSKNNEQPGSYDEYNSYSSEIDGASGSIEQQRPYIIHIDKHDIHFKENDINGYGNVSPSNRNKQTGSYDEYNSYFREIDDSSESHEHRGPYVLDKDKYNSYSIEHDINNYPSKSNKQPGFYDEYNSYSSEIDGSSGSIEKQRPYAIDIDKHNSHSKEYDITNYENIRPSKRNKQLGSYDEYDSYSSIINDSPESTEHRGLYVINNDKYNSYSKENDINKYDEFNLSKNKERPGSYHEYNSYSTEIDGSSGSIEQQRPYIIHIDKYNSYSNKKDKNNYPYEGNEQPDSYDEYNSHSSEIEDSFGSNEHQGPFIKDIDKYNSYSNKKDKNNNPYEGNEQPDSYDEYNSHFTEIEDSFGNNEHQGPFIIDNDRHNSYSKENDIKQYENDDGSSESKEIERPYDSWTKKDSNASVDFPEDFPPSEENHNQPYNGKNKPNNENTSYYKDNQSNKIRENIEDVLTENNIYKDNNKHKHHHEHSLRHRKKPKPSSDLPQYIIKPDQSFDTIRIIPAPRLTSLVIKMCDKSNINVLEIWKKVAKHLGLDSDYSVSNIHHVEELFKIIRTFVVLSKNKNFLNMPLSKILATIRDKISKESDDRSVEAYKSEHYDDRYDSEYYSAENELRELHGSSDFHVETSLEPVELSDFLKYVFENQKDSHVDAEENDNSDSLISDESDSKVLKKFVNKYNSEEFRSDDDDVSNDRRINEISDFDSTELPFDSAVLLDSSEPNNSHKSSTNVLDILPSLDIISSLEQQDSIISEENTDVPNDNENEDPRPYTPNSDIVMELPLSDINDTNEPAVLEDISEFNLHENGSEGNISQPLLCPVITEPISQKEPSSSEDHNVSKDLLSNLIPYIMGTNINKFILPFMENNGQCRKPIHEELLQKVKEIIELLQKAECF